MVYELDINSKSDELLAILVQTQKFEDFADAKSPLAFKMSALRKQSQIIPLQQLQYRFEDNDTFISLVAENHRVNYGNK